MQVKKMCYLFSIHEVTNVIIKKKRTDSITRKNLKKQNKKDGTQHYYHT